jgi:serine/threonine protein kinase
VLDDKWTLERLLGIGGMAAVYAARHRNGARAAVKVLHPHLSHHKEVRERFQREGYAANQVEHPGAVKVLDDDVVADGPDKGTAYIVMELLAGQSLQDRLEKGPAIGELEFLQIADGVLEVLDAAHARGVVHRDLKPENLFLALPEGGDAGDKVQVKVLDFGLARLLQGQSITAYGLALGTPSFMSPEQAAGRLDEIDGRTDLFALAATGFRLRSGRRIHEGDNAVELVTKMSKLAAPRIRTIAADVSDPFARVIDRALEFRREDRYETAAAMRKDVRKAIDQLEAGVARTHLAVGALSGAPPPPKAKPPRSERTVELSARDLEVVAPIPEESIRIPKRRSLLPWLALLTFGGIGTKVWIDAGRPWGFGIPTPPVSAPEARGDPLDAESAIRADAMAGVPPDGASMAQAIKAAKAPLPPQSSSALATSPPHLPPPPPVKTGPASAHKLLKRH